MQSVRQLAPLAGSATTTARMSVRRTAPRRGYATANDQAGTSASVNNATLQGHQVKGGIDPAKAAASSSSSSSSSSSVSSSSSALASKGSAAADKAKESAQVMAKYLPGLQYHTQTALALMKQVYVHQKLAPPSLAQVQTVYSSWWSHLRSPQWYIKTLEQLRTYSARDLGYIAIVVTEVYGIFAIGQMIGRRKIVGTLPKSPEELH